MEGVKSEAMNILLLVPLCCSPPVQQGHLLLACLQSSLSHGGTAGCL